MRDMPKRGARTATNKKTTPFTKGGPKAMEAKGEKTAPAKKLVRRAPTAYKNRLSAKE
jgi:hypothetical protein